MSDSDSKSPIFKIGLICILIIIISIVGSYFIFGPETALTIFQVAIFVTLGGAVIGTLIAIGIFLFSKKRIDVLETRNDNIINSSKHSKVPYKQIMCFRGDEYIGTRKIGDVVGFCLSTTQPEEVIKRDEKGLDYLETVKGTEKVGVFVVFKNGILQTLKLKKPDIFFGVIDDFCGGLKALSSHTIYLNGTTFGPRLHGCYFLSRHWGNLTLINKTAKSDVFQYNFQELLRESKSIFDSAINLDQQFVKHREVSTIETVPMSGGQR